ncbi:MAG: glycosyltransferase family 1 protein [bacterium]
MKVCLDLRTSAGPMHGIARYGGELARALSGLRHLPPLLILAGRKGIPDPPDGTAFRLLRSAVRPYGLLEQFWIPCLIARTEADLYHCVTYGCPALVSQPFLFTLHDLIPLMQRREHGLAKRIYFQVIVRCALRRCRKLLVVSEYTRSCLIRWAPDCSDKIRVVLPAGDHILRTSISPADELRFLAINPEKRPFFLSVANARPHKNIRLALRAFSCLARESADGPIYILVGPQHPQVHAYAAVSGVGDRIRFAGEVSDGLLRLLYQRALALVFPAMGEGFGLPIVEAMQFGLPVLAADGGASPEVLGGTGFILSCDHVREWEEALSKVRTERLRERWDPSPVLDRARVFTWERVARETLGVYGEATEHAGAP